MFTPMDLKPLFGFGRWLLIGGVVLVFVLGIGAGWLLWG